MQLETGLFLPDVQCRDTAPQAASHSTPTEKRGFHRAFSFGNEATPTKKDTAKPPRFDRQMQTESERRQRHDRRNDTGCPCSCREQFQQNLPAAKKRTKVSTQTSSSFFFHETKPFFCRKYTHQAQTLKT